MVGILVLVHHHIAKTVLVLGQYFWKPRQELIGSQEQIVKIHGTGFEATLDIGLVDVAHFGTTGHGVCLEKIGVVSVGLYCNQTVFVLGYSPEYLLGFVAFFVELHLAYDGSQ